jgi:hypothetical protein
MPSSRNGSHLVTMHDLYPSTKALDDAIASGNTSGIGESFEQLDSFLSIWKRAWAGPETPDLHLEPATGYERESNLVWLEYD